MGIAGSVYPLERPIYATRPPGSRGSWRWNTDVADAVPRGLRKDNRRRQVKAGVCVVVHMVIIPNCTSDE